MWLWRKLWRLFRWESNVSCFLILYFVLFFFGFCWCCFLLVNAVAPLSLVHMLMLLMDWHLALVIRLSFSQASQLLFVFSGNDFCTTTMSMQQQQQQLCIVMIRNCVDFLSFQCGMHMARRSPNQSVPGKLKPGLHYGLQYVGLIFIYLFSFGRFCFLFLFLVASRARSLSFLWRIFVCPVRKLIFRFGFWFQNREKNNPRRNPNERRWGKNEK